jgi:allantoin racemase
MRIRIISPVTNQKLVNASSNGFIEKARSDTLISTVMLEKGPASVESIYEEALAVPGVLRRVLEAEKDGMDAVLINCMNDPGLEASREVTSIPVVGAAQSSMLLASLLAHKFSVISTAARDVYPIELLIRRYGLKDKYASTRWVDIPVLELENDEDKLVGALVEESEKAIQLDGANAIVFGCTGMHTVVEKVNKKLKERHLDAIVIDPTLAALKWAEMLVALKVTQSRRTYPSIKDQLLPEHRIHSVGSIPEFSGKLTTNPRIHIMVPVVKGYRDKNWLDSTQRDYSSYARKGTIIHTEAIETGPQTIETWYLKQMAVPEMLRLTREAEQKGATAAIIDCMSDPSLDAAREVARIPVVGPAQSSAFVAASLAHRFSILGTRADMGHKFVNQMEEYGITAKLASVRTTGLSVQEVESNPDALFHALIQEGEKAVTLDSAHILIPGCTGMIGIADKLRQSLLAIGIDVPVLEPPAVAVKMAEILSDLQLAQSKITYPIPPEKSISGFSHLEIHNSLKE